MPPLKENDRKIGNKKIIFIIVSIIVIIAILYVGFIIDPSWSDIVSKGKKRIFRFNLENSTATPTLIR